MVIDLGNGISGIKFEKEHINEVFNFIHTRGKTINRPILTYDATIEEYIFGKTKEVLTDGMFLLYKEKFQHFVITKDANWIFRYQY